MRSTSDGLGRSGAIQSLVAVQRRVFWKQDSVAGPPSAPCEAEQSVEKARKAFAVCFRVRVGALSKTGPAASKKLGNWSGGGRTGARRGRADRYDSRGVQAGNSRATAPVVKQYHLELVPKGAEYPGARESCVECWSRTRDDRPPSALFSLSPLPRLQLQHQSGSRYQLPELVPISPLHTSALSSLLLHLPPPGPPRPPLVLVALSSPPHRVNIPHRQATDLL